MKTIILGNKTDILKRGPRAPNHPAGPPNTQKTKAPSTGEEPGTQEPTWEAASSDRGRREGEGKGEPRRRTERPRAPDEFTKEDIQRGRNRKDNTITHGPATRQLKTPTN